MLGSRLKMLGSQRNAVPGGEASGAMFSGFDLGAGLSRLNATISSIQDELSQEHAKTVSDKDQEQAPSDTLPRGAAADAAHAGGADAPAEATPPETAPPKKKVVKKVAKKAAQEPVASIPEEKQAPGSYAQPSAAEVAGAGGAAVPAEAAPAEGAPKVKKVKKVVKKVPRNNGAGETDEGKPAKAKLVKVPKKINAEGAELSAEADGAAKPKKKLVKKLVKRTPQQAPLAEEAPGAGDSPSVDIAVTLPPLAGASGAAEAATGPEAAVASPKPADAPQAADPKAPGSPKRPSQVTGDAPRVEPAARSPGQPAEPLHDPPVHELEVTGHTEARAVEVQVEAGAEAAPVVGPEVAGWEDEGWGGAEGWGEEASEELLVGAQNGVAEVVAPVPMEEEVPGFAQGAAVVQEQGPEWDSMPAVEAEVEVEPAAGAYEAAIALGVAELMEEIVQRVEVLIQDASPVKRPAAGGSSVGPERTGPTSPWLDNPAFESAGSTPVKKMAQSVSPVRAAVEALPPSLGTSGGGGGGMGAAESAEGERLGAGLEAVEVPSPGGASPAQGVAPMETAAAGGPVEVPKVEGLQQQEEEGGEVMGAEQAPSPAAGPERAAEDQESEEAQGSQGGDAEEVEGAVGAGGGTQAMGNSGAAQPSPQRSPERQDRLQGEQRVEVLLQDDGPDSTGETEGSEEAVEDCACGSTQPSPEGSQAMDEEEEEQEEEIVKELPEEADTQHVEGEAASAGEDGRAVNSPGAVAPPTLPSPAKEECLRQEEHIAEPLAEAGRGIVSSPPSTTKEEPLEAEERAETLEEAGIPAEEEEDEEDDGQFAWADSHESPEAAKSSATPAKRDTSPGTYPGDEGVADLLRRMSDSRAQAEPVMTPAPDAAQTVSLEGKSWQEMAEVVASLQAVLATREAQLQRKGEEVVMMQEVQDTLMERNEQLVRKAHKVSQEDIDELQKEFETRLGAAERKVYALTKERDALKRGAERLANMEGILKQKDEAVRAAGAETAEVARKLSEAQSTNKALQKQMQRMEAEQTRVSAKIVAEQQKADSILQAKDRAEGELRAAFQRAAADMETQRQHYEGLLSRARESQQAAEQRAQEAAKERAARKDKESSVQAAALVDTVAELRDALDRQRRAAELREEMLRQDVKDMERRCMDAERRHEELSAKFPETTRPLLRQIESLQQAASAQEEAWRASDQNLSSRLADAEARSTAAAERERLASERLAGAQNRIAGIEAALEAVREDSAQVHEQLEGAAAARKRAEKAGAEAADALRGARAELEALRAERATFAHDAAEELEMERKARRAAVQDAETVKKSCEMRVASLQAELARLGGDAGAAEEEGAAPPAMAAPGYKWVLVKEGQDAAAAAAAQAQPPAGEAAGADGYGEHRGEGTQETERLRAKIASKEGEIGTLQEQVAHLEATRDSLSEELVQAMQARDEQGELRGELEALQAQYKSLQMRHANAVELLGEREERLEELREDLQDVKLLYRDQIEYMVEQVVALTPRSTPNLTPAASATFQPGGGELPVSTAAAEEAALVDDDVPSGRDLV
eukprot:jgi/Tetstr1/453183/TSEL_040200.t1